MSGPDVGRTYARMLRVSALALLLEAALALVVVLVADSTEAPDPAEDTVSPFAVVLVPILGVFGVVVALAVSAMVVLPAIGAGESLARRSGGRPAWWQLGLAAAVGLLAAPLGGWRGWAVTAAAAAGAILLARHARRGFFVSLLLWGTLAVLSVGTLGGIALYTGVIEPYERPRPTAQALVGTWTDGRDARLTLAADGRATAAGITYGEWDGSREASKDCGGQGTWRLKSHPDGWADEVEVTLPDCPWSTWAVGGTDAALALGQNLGDEGDDPYVLRRLPAPTR
ncbi:hypothetical protein [Streptomyces sp. NPDC004284]|uniref:hypothetical protein n=1 Tax=Streptomyces sp. NPDC004284 TaxID=3364695 RepID=UPI0036BF22B3